MRITTSRGSRAPRSLAVGSAAVAGLLLLAGCGSGGSPASASPQTAAGSTVTVQTAGGTQVLATSSGQTLYTSAQEVGRTLCTSPACVQVWVPLTVPAGQQPTASGGVAATSLGTITRPDGSRQVTFDGRPLYTFSLDHGAGQDNGNGQQDSFGGTAFTWHAATPMGTAPTSAPTSGSSGGGGYGY